MENRNKEKILVKKKIGEWHPKTISVEKEARPSLVEVAAEATPAPSPRRTNSGDPENGFSLVPWVHFS